MTNQSTRTVDEETRDPAALRGLMVDALVAESTITSAAVKAAMRAVPRERFLPGESLDEVFQLERGVVTKQDDDGVAVSSVSAPRLQAYMLEQAQIAPGMRVLEIGSGGYNAALLAEMVGTGGHVTSVDIDPFVTDRATELLAATGYGDRVEVVLADANEPLAGAASFDRVLVTVGAWDVPPSWFAQLIEGGRIIVPLQVLGLSNTITFVKRDGLLVSTDFRAFGFVPMRGAGEHDATLLVLRDGEVTLRFDDEPPADPDAAARALEGVFDTPRVEVDSGAPLRNDEPWLAYQMWAATGLDGFCRVVIDKEKTTGLVTPPGRHIAAMAVLAGSSLAYATTRRADSDNDNDNGEHGGDLRWWAHAYGPDADLLARRVADRLSAFAQGPRRSGTRPTFTIAPAGTPEADLPAGRIVDKRHSRVVISWPA
jgi:protein-L-isoaspartate(D-aspartate) O-methyltransferase